MQIDEPIAGQFWILIGIVADKIATADDGHVGADCQLRSGREIDAQLSLVEREPGDPVARHHMDVTARICHGVVWRRQVSSKLIRSVEKTVAGVEQPLRRLILNACLKSLAACARDVLEKAAALDDTGDVYDVVAGVGAEQRGLPFELAAA